MRMKTVQNRVSRAKSLRHAMLGNAGFSGLSGVALLAGATPIGEFIGVANPLPLRVLGGILIIYGGMLFWAAVQRSVQKRHGIAATVLDIGWVVGSLALLITELPALTIAGKWMVALLAEAVLFFAIWQAYAMGYLRTRSQRVSGKPVNSR